MCEGLDPAKWYRVSAWVRGGAVSLSFYEYFASGKIGGQGVLQSTVGHEAWKRIEGFYRPPADGYLRSALAIAVPPGQTADVDDVAIEPMDLPAVPAGADIALETDAVRLAISSQGLLREFRSKPSGKDYAVAGTPVPVLHAVCRGVATPLHSLTREGDVIRAQFLDPEVRATLRVSPRKHHLLFEVVDVQPAGVEELTLRFPVRRLAAVGGAFNATYDDQFGVCLLGVTENTDQQTVPHGAEVLSLAARCTSQHGIAGARFALVAADRDQFEPAIMEAERENGLPCPMLEGKWARSSEPVRRSYLFMVDAKESNIDRIIEYAKLGNFGMIIFLKDNWLATHGHFQINTNNFPDGVASLKRAVAKIHAAGMGAGVHVFGPSISPNDPYITPQPDDRLASVACPPLAEAVDEKATVLVLAGEPQPSAEGTPQRRLSRLPPPHRRRAHPLSESGTRTDAPVHRLPARRAGHEGGASREGSGGQGPAHDVGLLPRRSRQHAGRRTHRQLRRGVQRVRLRHGLFRRQRRHQRRLPRPLVLSEQAAPGLLPQVQEGRALPDEQRHGQRPGLAHRPPQCVGRRPRRPEEVPRRAAAGDAGHGRQLHASRRRLVLHVCRRPARPDRIRLCQDDRPGRFDFHRDLPGDDGPARPRPADDRDGGPLRAVPAGPSLSPKACASNFASRARISSSLRRRQRLADSTAPPTRSRAMWNRSTARRTCGRSGTTSRPRAPWASRSPAAPAMSRRATTTRPAPSRSKASTMRRRFAGTTRPAPSAISPART